MAKIVQAIAVGSERRRAAGRACVALARELPGGLEALWLGRFSRIDTLLDETPTAEQAMPITAVTSDAEALTLTVVGDYPVPVERLWEAYADPRQLERFWGPETWPATFTRHDMAEGGRSAYYMTGPEGERSHGWWRFLAVEPGRRFEVEDGFAHDDGTPNDAMPTMRMVFSFEPTATGSRLASVTHFPSAEAMERLVEMGMVEGLRSALGQLDHVLADLE